MASKAMEDVKVADFAWYAAGPMVCKWLAEHGAEVVHVESSTRPDGMRTTPPFRDDKPGLNRSGPFTMYNDGKYSVVLNLKHPQGQEVARKIVAWSDIVVENFTPGTMSGFGLSYEELKKIKPDIIMLSTCNQGQTGPHRMQPGFGSHLAALSGFVELTGWPDRPPLNLFAAYTDLIAVAFGTVAVLAALDYKHRTGKGLYIDLSQYECSLHFLAPLLLHYGTDKKLATRAGNRSISAAPHGFFPCLGEDRWCAIAVHSDEEWQGFCRAIGNPAWTKDARFTTLNARKKNEDELERLVSDWTSQFTAEEVMQRLQAAGVPAGVASNPRDVVLDPQLEHRHQWWYLDHPELGRHANLAPPLILSKSPAELRRRAPWLGEHTEYVCTKILGITDEEFVRLLEAGVFT